MWLQKTVPDYIGAAGEAVRALLETARQVIGEELPQVEEYMKWGAPAYRLPNGEQLLYLYGGDNHVNLGFLLGADLDDPEKLLLGAGSKASRHVEINTSEDVTNDAVRDLIRQSAQAQS